MVSRIRRTLEAPASGPSGPLFLRRAVGRALSSNGRTERPHRKGDSGCLPVRQTQRLLSKKTARMGDEGKAAGCRSPAALLSEQARQYKISKIKLSISMIAVTPATESTK